MTSPSVRQLVYVSLAAVPFSPTDLATLLERSRVRNSAVNVTGVLLHEAGSFLQVLEGDPDVVDSVYHRVSLDRRHRHVVMLLRQMVENRSFGDWSMGFIDVTGRAGRLPGFRPGMTFSDLVGNPATLLKLVSEFRAGRWRPSVAA